MALQSRFGTDERFRMDSRFLEEDEKQEEESGEAAGDVFGYPPSMMFSQYQMLLLVFCYC